MGRETYTFLVNNIEILFNNRNSIIKLKNKSLLPKSITNIYKSKHYKIYDHGVICHDMVYDLMFEYSITNQPKVFDWKMYYAVYHLNIETKFESESHMSEEEKTIIYFIKYGFWYRMFIPNIDIHMVKEYRASYDDLHQMSVIDARTHMIENKRPITFSRWIYLASNFNNLNNIRHDQLSDHYITNGKHTGLSSVCFDHNRFMCDYPLSIRLILNKNYDFSLLTKPRVAQFYVEHKNTITKYKSSVVFLETDFVREFVNDRRVNYDNDMSVNNAYIYFVKGYAENSDIRQYINRVYKLKRFFKMQCREALAQVPFGIMRYLLEFKLYM